MCEVDLLTKSHLSCCALGAHLVELLLVSTNVLVRWGLRGNQMKLWSLPQCENPGLSKVPSFKPGGGQNRALCVSLCNRVFKGVFF